MTSVKFALNNMPDPNGRAECSIGSQGGGPATETVLRTFVAGRARSGLKTQAHPRWSVRLLTDPIAEYWPMEVRPTVESRLNRVKTETPEANNHCAMPGNSGAPTIRGGSERTTGPVTAANGCSVCVSTAFQPSPPPHF